MNSRTFAVAFLALGLAACGNKGALVLPTAPPPEQESPSPATPTPETLNDQQNSTPPEGDASDAGDAGTPPPVVPARTP